MSIVLRMAASEVRSTVSMTTIETSPDISEGPGLPGLVYNTLEFDKTQLCSRLTRLVLKH